MTLTGDLSAFSVRVALEDAEALEEATPESRMSIRSYAVETNLGYWVPEPLYATVEKKLAMASEPKRTRLAKLAQVVEKASEDTLVKRYLDYCDRTADLLQEVRLPVEPDLLERARDPAHVVRFLSRLRSRLSDEIYVRRIAEAYRFSPMPEIWNDPVDLVEFRESFFDYLEYAGSQKKTGSVPTAILKALDLHRAGADSDVIEQALCAYLDQPGWTDADWDRTSRRRSRKGARRAKTVREA